MGHRRTDRAAVADNDHVLIPVPYSKIFQRGTGTLDHFSQCLAARRALMAGKRPKGVLRQRKARRQLGVWQALPFAEALLDQARFHLWFDARVAGGKDRLGSSPGAR